ncbi:hypothetical protein [Chitinibacter sp. S2-10]|uniref:hypothetical protein n=1 Tax=Chitinibacter sp. S2-10 TaxID=3373597 RepID=UPI0039773CB8
MKNDLHTPDQQGQQLARLLKQAQPYATVRRELLAARQRAMLTQSRPAYGSVLIWAQQYRVWLIGLALLIALLGWQRVQQTAAYNGAVTEQWVDEVLYDSLDNE